MTASREVCEASSSQQHRACPKAAQAANVRTLALVEVLFALAVSRRLFAQTTTARDYAGMALIVGGVALLLAGAA